MKKLTYIFAAVTLFVTVFSCNLSGQSKNGIRKVKLVAPKGKAIAAFAEGCFWCSEHIFEDVVGVDSAVSGYAGGKTQYPTYDDVTTETTGHAETTLVYYDPQKVSYQELLRVFFASHDPTTLNRQGPDEGSSYRSVIFYQTPQEKGFAQQAVRDATKSGKFANPIVTELTPLTVFWRAEEYHQDYVKHNPNNPYIKNVSLPRFMQFKKASQKGLKN